MCPLPIPCTFVPLPAAPHPPCVSLCLRQCVYGVVITSDTGVKSCQCNAGWVGDRCSEPVSSHCYRGSWDKQHGFCRCDPLWAGEVRAAARPGTSLLSLTVVLPPPLPRRSHVCMCAAISESTSFSACCALDQGCDIYTCMHGTAVSTGVDMNGAPTMACQCQPDWAGAEYVCTSSRSLCSGNSR